MDAHESAGNDFSVVTRIAQNNDTQRWILKPLGDDSYTIQQKSNGRFVDAHESAGNDFSLVSRPEQNNDTQRWILTPVGGGFTTYTIQQKSNGRFVDAHEGSANDFSLVTRTVQNNATQRWILTPSPFLEKKVRVLGAPSHRCQNPSLCVDNLEPWAGASGLRPWAPPENEQCFYGFHLKEKENHHGTWRWNP